MVMRGQLFVMRIMYGALLIGQGMFLVVALMAGQTGDPGPLRLIAFGVAAALALASFAIPKAMAVEAKADTPLVDLLGRYFVIKLMQFSLLEGAGLLNGVVFFLSGDKASLGVAVAMAALMAIQPPSAGEFAKLFRFPGHRQHELEQ